MDAVQLQELIIINVAQNGNWLCLELIKVAAGIKKKELYKIIEIKWNIRLINHWVVNENAVAL